MSNSYFGFDPEKVKVNWRESRFDNLPPLDTESENTKQKSEKQKPKSKQCKKSFFNMTQLKKYPLVFCVLICVIFYFLFLSLVFTNEKEIITYKLYTTENDDYFHVDDCSVLIINIQENNGKIRQTTAYELNNNYKACNKCLPYKDSYQYSTTITVTERDYLTSALISIPISAVIYILIVNKKEESKGDDL